MTGTRRLQYGMTLVEVLIAVAVGAIVLSALGSIVSLGLRAQVSGRQQNELVYQGRFALERMVARARSVPPRLLAAPAAGTTGDWFAPAGCVGAACVMYCRNAANQLIETTTADAACAGTTVIATNVTAFSAALIASVGPVDRPIGSLSLTLTQGDAPQPVTLATSVRLGGGTL
jgi:prepilin-type N-terminal cleavage/methylation domain-containing protein